MSMFTYTQKTNEVYADTENACYSEEMLNLMFYRFFGQGGGPLFGDENHDTDNIYHG